ncbi:GntR family transcriptional regulator [Saccharopolyspora sp. K220]|uniref:GntR family transcriptional regulator n=1 Tax=Saccharopolyspora soli TaxID=2926618 RepID=UPI001F58D30D|nr:GntR family transcriptional regulator [Saccharopolyspora soli]MCI2423138.1 GntR family transcriptional regulator [Saccharopolyspora soli]
MAEAVSTGQLSVSSLRQQAHRRIRTSLVTGRISPGQIYSAQVVAAELGVSVTPVREAMLELVNEGLLTPVRNRGYRVVELTPQDMAEVYELRELLEVAALTKLAADPPVAQREHFLGLVREMQRCADVGDVASFLEAERSFHLGLIELAGNRRLLNNVAKLRDQTRLFGIAPLAREGGLREAADQHGELLDAVLAGDALRTGQLMRDHYTRAVSPGQPVDEKATTG